MNNNKIEQKFRTELNKNVRLYQLDFNDKLNFRLWYRTEPTLNSLIKLKEDIEKVKLSPKDYDAEKTLLFGKVEVIDIKIYSDEICIFLKLPITHVSLNSSYSEVWHIIEYDDNPEEQIKRIKKYLEQLNPELTITKPQIKRFIKYLKED